jgi:hypothetical protein
MFPKSISSHSTRQEPARQLAKKLAGCSSRKILSEAVPGASTAIPVVTRVETSLCKAPESVLVQYGASYAA